MKSSLAVLFFAGFVLVFSSATTHGHDEFDILTPEGNYKHGKLEFKQFQFTPN